MLNLVVPRVKTRIEKVKHDRLTVGGRVFLLLAPDAFPHRGLFPKKRWIKGWMVSQTFWMWL